MIQITLPDGVSYSDLARAYGFPEEELRAINPSSGELRGGQSINLPIQEPWLRGTPYKYIDDIEERARLDRQADAIGDEDFLAVADRPVAGIEVRPKREEYVTPLTTLSPQRL